MRLNDHECPEDLNGKTVESCVDLYSFRLSKRYLLIKFTDGTRQVCQTSDMKVSPHFLSKEMKKRRCFFTPEEIAKAVKLEEENIRKTEERKRAYKLREYERLGRELGKE